MTRMDRKCHLDAWLRGKISLEDYYEKHGISLGTFIRWIANYAYPERVNMFWTNLARIGFFKERFGGQVSVCL